MSTIFEIPLSDQPTTQVIALGGIQYQITTKWNDKAQCWFMDIADSNGNKILSGAPLITGADLLAQYGYLMIAGGGAMVVQSDNNPDLVPNDTTLGTTGHLFYVSP